MKYQRQPYKSSQFNDFILVPDEEGDYLAEVTPVSIHSINGAKEIRWIVSGENNNLDENAEVIHRFAVIGRKGKALYDLIPEREPFDYQGKTLRVSEKFISPGGSGTGCNVVLQIFQDDHWVDYCRANTLSELRDIAAATES